MLGLNYINSADGASDGSETSALADRLDQASAHRELGIANQRLSRVRRNADAWAAVAGRDATKYKNGHGFPPNIRAAT